MSYIINESVMNGTVTIAINNLIVNAETWEEACKRFEDYVSDRNNLGPIEIIEKNDEYLHYRVPQPDSPMVFEVYGEMKNISITTID